MTHASPRRLELSRVTPGAPSAISNIMVTALFGVALTGLFAVSWLWATR